MMQLFSQLELQFMYLMRSIIYDLAVKFREKKISWGCGPHRARREECSLPSKVYRVIHKGRSHGGGRRVYPNADKSVQGEGVDFLLYFCGRSR